jgi:hypothetical protein
MNANTELYRDTRYGEPPGSLAGIQGLEARAHDGGLFAEAAEARSLLEQLIVDIPRRSYVSVSLIDAATRVA